MKELKSSLFLKTHGHQAANQPTLEWLLSIITGVLWGKKEQDVFFAFSSQAVNKKQELVLAHFSSSHSNAVDAVEL